MEIRPYKERLGYTVGLIRLSTPNLLRFLKTVFSFQHSPEKASARTASSDVLLTKCRNGAAIQNTAQYREQNKLAVGTV